MGRASEEGVLDPIQYFWTSLITQSVSKESSYNAGDLALIAGVGRTPGREHGNPLQYSCLEALHVA